MSKTHCNRSVALTQKAETDNDMTSSIVASVWQNTSVEYGQILCIFIYYYDRWQPDIQLYSDIIHSYTEIKPKKHKNVLFCH